MQDDNFSDYQDLRSSIEKEMRTTIGGWALGEAPDAMTFEQVRRLTDSVVVLMNVTTRKCWDLGRQKS